MSKLTRKRTILAKIESVYGTDPSPTGSADSVLIRNLNVKPISGGLVSRDLIRPYLGNSPQLLAEKAVDLDFEIELVGSGVVGLAPAAGYDALLRACGFTKSTTLVTCTAISAAAVVTVTKTAHGYVTGDKITHTGFTDTNKNIAAVITRLTADTYSYPAPSATDENPAAGSPKINSAVVYVPISASFESVTIYFNVDGILHSITGVQGSFDLDLTVKTIPTLKFTMKGLYNVPTDTAAPSSDFSKYQQPQVVSTQATTGFSINGYSGNLQSFKANMAVDVQHIVLVGSDTVKILDRKPAGTVVFELPPIASHNFYNDIANSTLGDIAITQGQNNGFKVGIDCPSCLLGDPTLQDSNGVQMLSCPFTISPVTGNDEISITMK